PADRRLSAGRPAVLAVHRRSARQSRHALRHARCTERPAGGPEEAPRALAHRLDRSTLMSTFGTQSSAATWIRRLALVGLLLCFVVVVLGAYVRLTEAGLGCPDWPGCYGHLTPIGAEQSAASQAAYPNTPLQVGKAWREMIHRYAATTLGLIIVLITALAI